MSRDKSTYKEAFNRALVLVNELGIEADLPTEAGLADQWHTSRTTVRAVLTQLNRSGVISWQGRRKTVLRKPARADFFATEETRPVSERVESQFMHHILGGDLKPGTILREADLVREFDTSTSVVRELMIRFSRFGLIEKEPNRHWVLRGFTRDFAEELLDVREMFERRAFRALLDAGPQSPAQQALLALREEHERIASDISSTYLEFPRLDEAFHRAWINPLGNRFIIDFFGLVSIIFHYHYRWNKRDEPERNLNAALQHLAVIDAVADRDNALAQQRLDEHLLVARATLIASVPWEG